MKKLACILLATIQFLQLFSNVVNSKPKKPKNIILLIGDGMGLATMYAAYTANGGHLDIFQFANILGLSITASASDYITDSAAGATAFASGVKTTNGMLGMKPDSTPVTTIFEDAKKKGMATGIVVSCELQHATPAAFYAHQPDRNLFGAIGHDLAKSTLNVAIGGGFPYMDTLELISNGFQISVGDNSMYKNHSNKQICFYNRDSVPASLLNGRGDALIHGSVHALKELSRNKKGFMLMIEGSQIDWGEHAKDSAYTISEMQEFDKISGELLKWAMHDKNTLVIITADHECGGISLTGYDSTHKMPVVNFSTNHHTAIPVPVFAFGPGAEMFQGVYQNTEIYFKMKKLMEL